MLGSTIDPIINKIVAFAIFNVLQYYGSPPPNFMQVRNYVENSINFPCQWIGRRGPTDRPDSYSADLIPIDIFIGILECVKS